MIDKKELADNAMKLFQGGMSWDEVATTLGVSNGFLYRVRNIHLPNTIRQKNKWTKETEEICFSLSKRGASFTELYEALPNFCHDYIRERVAKLGLSYVKTRVRERATTKAELHKMLKQGDTNIQIAQKIGCTSDHVGRLIAQFGLRRTDADLSLMRSRMNKERRERKALLAKAEEPKKEDRKSVQYFEDKLQKLEEQRIEAIGTERFHSLTGEINALRIKITILKQTLKPSAIERDNLC